MCDFAKRISAHEQVLYMLVMLRVQKEEAEKCTVYKCTLIYLTESENPVTKPLMELSGYENT